MVKHLVLWNLKDSALGDTKKNNALQIKEKLEALNGLIPGLLHLEVGLDFTEGTGNADVALYAELASPEALVAYQQHPAHLQVLPFIKAVTSSRVAVDYELPR
jgi:hypothetical protein